MLIESFELARIGFHSFPSALDVPDLKTPRSVARYSVDVSLLFILTQVLILPCNSC